MSENRSPFENLEDRIGKLLKMVADLSAENSRLRSELQALADGETGELAETLQRLKKENKLLKEKENLVRSKVERLTEKINELSE